MVFPGQKGKESVCEYMAMGPDRSKTLHNFTLPHLNWGNQRFLSCVKVDSSAAEASADGGADRRLRRGSSASEFGEFSVTIASGTGDSEVWHRRSVAAPWQSGGEVEEGIEAVREKLMLDLRKDMDKMKKSILTEEEISVDEDDEGEEKENDKKKDKQMDKKEKVTEDVPPSPVETAVEEVLPWNLRTRRGASTAASKAWPIGEAGNGSFNGYNNRALRIADKKVNHSAVRSVGPRSAAVTTERPKFSVALKKKEIEEDFMAMVGRRPPRRPKKRPRHVQKQTDTLFPGQWMTEVTPDLYKR